MQTVPYNFLLDLDMEQAYVPNDTDTAQPQTLIPIYYIHAISTPFCTRPHCICQQGRQAVTALYREIAKGDVLLAQLTHVLERSEAMQTGETSQTVHRVHVDIVPGIPEQCQLFGHQWEYSSDPGVKACTLCGIRGYCPRCGFILPPNARPFRCTRHTQRRQVEQ